MNKIDYYLAYCIDNQDIASYIIRHFKAVGIDMAPVVATQVEGEAPLQERLKELDKYIFLLISDNFLKNLNCMNRGLFMLHEIVADNRGVPIILDGRYPKEGSTDFESVPTQFERMTHVIKYMNYWQDMYLDMRKERRSIPEKDLEKFDIKLKVVRSISSEMGEFLKNLRNANKWEYEDFSKNNFESFFRTIQRPELHQQLQNAIAQGAVPGDSTPSPAVENVSEISPKEQEPIPTANELPVSSTDDLEKTKAVEETEYGTSILLDETMEDEIILPEPEVTEAVVKPSELETIKEEEPEMIAPKTEEPTTPQHPLLEDIMKKEETPIPSVTPSIEESIYANKVLEKTEESKTALERIMETPFPTPDMEVPPIHDIETPAMPEYVAPEMPEMEPINIPAISEKKDKAAPPKATEEKEDHTFEVTTEKIKTKGKKPLLERLIEYKEEISLLNDWGDRPPRMEDKIDKIVEGVVEEERNDALLEGEIKMERSHAILDSIFDDDENGEEENYSDSIDTAVDQEMAELARTRYATPTAQVEKPNWKTTLKEGKDLIKSGKIYTGLNIIRGAVDENPKNPILRMEYATYLMEGAESYKAAKRELEKVVKLDPKNVQAYINLAKVSEKREDYLLAKSYLEKALSLDDDNADAYHRLGILISTKFPDLQDQAAKYFKKAIKKNPKNADAHYRLGVMLDEHLAKPKKALKQFKKTLKLQPDHPFVNYDLALIYHRLGNFKKAARYYKAACKINPEFKSKANDKAFLESFKKKKKKILEEGYTYPTNGFVPEEVPFPNTPDIIFEEPDESPKDVSPKKKELGKVVFISGATSGIGKATAEVFAKNGFRIIMNGRRTERLLELKEEFEKSYDANIKILPFDVRNPQAVQNAVDTLDEEWSKVDILINNAGLAKGFHPIHEGHLEDWETMIDTNIKGILYLTRIIAPKMVARKSGHIINVCSSAGKEVYPNGNVYCATKFAVDALTKAMRLDLYQHNLRVSQVSPGHVEETEFASVRFDWDPEKSNIYKDFQPLKSTDVGEAIYFIASQPPHVNIQDIILNGKQQASNVFIDRSGR